MNAAADGLPHVRPRRAALAGLALALALMLHAAVAWTLLGASSREPVRTVHSAIVVSLLEAPRKPAPTAERVPERPAPARREPPARTVRPAQAPPPQVAAPVRMAAPLPPAPLAPEPVVPAPAPVLAAAPAATSAAPAEVAPATPMGAPLLPGSDAVPARAAPPAPARASVAAGVVCANFKTAMGDAAFPREALRRGLDKGEALVEFTLGAAGQIRDVKAVSASHPVFARSSMRIVQALECAGQGHDLVVQVPFNYRLQ